MRRGNARPDEWRDRYALCGTAGKMRYQNIPI